MGSEADDILSSFNLTEANKKKWKQVNDKFRNILFQTGMLSLRDQNLIAKARGRRNSRQFV